MSARWIALTALLLALLAAGYWLLPAYVLPPMDLSQRPPERSAPLPSPSPVTSYVSIPLALSVDKIKQLVRDELSGKILTDNIKVPGRNLKVSIQRNGTMALWVKDSELHLVLPIRFRTSGDYKVKGELTLFTRASFDVSEDWQSLVDARSTFRWDWQPRVGFWPFRFRIGDILAPYIQIALDQGADDFRTKAGSLYDLRAVAETGWKRLAGPHPLDAPSQTWLAMQPRELYLEPITSDDTEVRMNLWMAGELGLVQGRQPEAAESLPLPRLRRGVPPSRSVVMSAPVTIAYERLLASLREAMIGKTLPSAAGQLTVIGLELYGSDASVVLALDFEGQRAGSRLPTRGRLYLQGRPDYDVTTRILSIRGLQLTEPGANPLMHGARWVLEQAPAWSAELERRMNWDAGPLLEQHRQQMDDHLNATVDSRFDLWGKIEALTVGGVQPQAQGVTLLSQARGELELLFVP